MYKKTQFENGLTLLTSKNDGTKAVTVLVLVGAGSRYETQNVRGIAHFLEHMFFKGAKKYKSAAEVSFAVDSVGGEFNAFTGKEYAGYYIKVAADHKDLAMDVLSDMMLNSTFKQEEIEKERGVIIEEYNMYQDTPMYQSGWDFEKLMFGDQPLGWDQIGLKEVINSVNHEDFVEYKNNLYTADNTVIGVSGNIDEDEIQESIQKYFQFNNAKKAYNFTPVIADNNSQRVKLSNKKTEQTHIVLGVPSVPARHKDNIAVKLLSIILGGNMSSRMFLNIREARGLSYYISTTTDDYLDAGILSTRAGVDNKRVLEAIQCIRDEYIKIREEGVIQEAELKKAKEYLKGKIILGLEDSEEIAHFYCKQALLYPNDIRNIEDVVEKIDQVTVQDIARLTNELLTLDKMKLVVIGPCEKEQVYLDLLDRKNI